MDSQKLRNNVNKIMELYMQGLFQEVKLEKELQDKIFNFLVDEATRLIESSFNEREIELYAQGSDLLLSIPAEKVRSLQISLGLSVATKIEELMSN